MDKAKSAIAAYVVNKAPTRSEQAALAGYAVRLAKLEALPRSDTLDPTFEEVDPDDVQDLLALLAVVPFDALLDDKVLRLNPTFGESSRLVGDADADLLTGDLLVDFKTTKSEEMKGIYLDQLLGYYLLARNQRGLDPTFPAVNRLGIYFCRHGHLWTANATVWTGQPQLAETEAWCFEHAKDVFSRPKETSPARPRRR